MVCEEGDVLWPDREDKPQLEAAKQRLGSYAYSSQWLQSPVPRGGALFREEWLHRTYREPPAQLRETSGARKTHHIGGTQ